MNHIKALNDKYKTIYSSILDNVRRYQKIAIFRHIHPDFDALGAQHALKEFIHSNFLDKDVRILGDNHDDLTPRLFPKTDTTKNEWFNEPFLAIVLDTPNKRRISDPRFKLAEATIKIDHHPFIEEIGELELIETEISSASELLANMFYALNLKITPTCASYLYIGIVGDSGRFEYNTRPHTFEITTKLLETGFNLTETYHNMYLHTENDLKVVAYILTHYTRSKKGVAYYLLNRCDLANFKITTNQAKDHVNLFHFIDGIKIWCAITEDQKENCYRVSLRSENIKINDVATKWRGGGHPNASGAKLLNLNELDEFIKDLDNLIK